MPHDANGVLLEKGDTVILKGKLVEVYTTEDACNVCVMFEGTGPGEVSNSVTLNSRQVIKDGGGG